MDSQQCQTSLGNLNNAPIYSDAQILKIIDKQNMPSNLTTIHLI